MDKSMEAKHTAAARLFVEHDEIDHNDGVAMMLKYAEALEAARAALAKAAGSAA